MIANWAGIVWKKLPWSFRSKIIRITQAKFTVSAAAVITNGQGEVLLLNHVLRPKSGWGLPGGFIEHGEQPDDGIRREIREETGIEMNNLRMLRVRTLGTHVEILFTAETVETPEVKSREIKDLGWFGSDRMPEKMNAAQKVLIEQVLNGSV
ncbi:MAG: NUDIX domain-containing protein [Pyrinomonadaceae bacterium]